LSGQEKRFGRLLLARLRSARGVVLLEFGVFAPFILAAIIFATDFLHVLCCEQQLEIACRALCDIEAHLKPGARRNESVYSGKFGKYKTGTTTHDVSGCPGKLGQLVVMHYLEEAIGNKSKVKILTEGKTSSTHAIYPRGYYYNQSGPLHTVINTIADLDGLGETIKNEVGDGLGSFLSVALKLFKSALDFFTFRCDRYLTAVFPSDKVVAVSLSVKVEPMVKLFKGGHPQMGLFYRKPSFKNSNSSVIPMYQPVPGNAGRRERFYYQMPSFDTVPIAPETYGRHMSSAFKRWIKDD